MSELNEPQRLAVAHVSGPLIVFAGAGSGKTRTITYRIVNLLATEHVPPYRILAVTFTNKAAAEMRQRVESLAGPEITRDLWIGTFHSICARLLRRYHAAVGLSRNYVIYDDGDQKAVLSRVLKDLKLSEQLFSPKLVLSLISKEKRDGFYPEDSRAERRMESSLLDVYDRYQAALLSSDAVDFDDLLGFATRIAESKTPEGDELRSRFHHVLVDEFQDTNLIQYRLVHALSRATRNLCVVGDDDQSIYRWRGADVRLIRNFRRDFADAQVIKLEQNYRSTGNIVKAALGVIEPAHEREPKVLWTDSADGEKVRVRAVSDEREEATFVANSIRSELGRGLRPEQVAVFYRVHAQSRALEEALRGLNIAYQIIGGMKFFERAEVKDLLAYLRFITNPRSDMDLLRIINVPARGIGDKTVERVASAAAENTCSAYDALNRLLDHDELQGAARKKLAGFRELIEELRDAARDLSPSKFAKHVLERTGYERLLKEEDSAEADARLGNLEELVGALQDYEKELEERDEQPTLEGYLERVSLIAGVDMLQDSKGVSLMTVHGAKGLEFDVVFLTGMEETIFPYKGVDQTHGTSEEELDEERRLAYVAITRARKRLAITHASMRQLFGRTHYLTPSRFLADLPERAIAREGSGLSAYGSAARFGAAARYSNTLRPYGGDDEPSFRAPPPALAPGTRFVERELDDSAGESVRVRPGSRVRHRHFGRGVVESVESGDSPVVVARFESVGKKRIKSEFLEFD
ncbi:MAG TPA: UvrD-helicase domain-containing protein [Polyangiaceae bacterium]|nr:UvrD-helicase domain-containing protein [Polyangiaceae bacterium]